MKHAFNIEDYEFGYTPYEIQRLINQAKILQPITDRLLTEAGIRTGMQVLEIGCGAGDLTRLIANRVGPSGHVTAVDVSSEAIRVARSRLYEDEGKHITFVQADADTFSDDQRFDALIGRYVLMHQPDPARTLRHLSGFLKPNGIVAFHELGLDGDYCSTPSVPLWEKLGMWIDKTFRLVAPSYNLGRQFAKVFAEVGLLEPHIFGEQLIGCGKSTPLIPWTVSTMHILLPAAIRYSIVDEYEVDIATLQARLAKEISATDGQILAPLQFCAWAKVPPVDSFRLGC
ncbi:class I SAM-dependent methyltransferase [Photorhabdus aegyptia]|uniref:class I SAM-dependent methyltransferase n=1 Tax=Photorhabdus aegyptia TaxID=2805098 RepID=UPI001E2A2F38|nr:class I SAM-dependent methyltransferase [Photorhabdus aegyptia]MCC8459087.1 class I SAM-dependent methyltransferase [Photorhabdus aegyptia]